jgi:hypothetical protein
VRCARQGDQARLHAHGHTHDGPAEWWWEYSSSRPALQSGGGTRVCGTGPDGRCGPARSAAEVRLSTLVTGLTPDTTYHFRACGQDTNDASPTCAAQLQDDEGPSGSRARPHDA